MRKMMSKELFMKRNQIIGCLAIGAMFWACSSSDSDSMDLGGGASGDAGVTAVVDWEVAGVSQKGPFVTGSAVTVQELDGITLKQTGKSFKGSIKSDKGDFAIKDINLESQYAILEASGYYRDEISGKKSSGMVTLRALTDLSNRKTVNINLLTHLEYERVLYLVNKKKMSIADAKAQAEEEVLASFAINGDFGESEDLNIFESGDGNAALLAVSVLMQGDADVAGLTERMGEFGISLAEGGRWDDADTKTAIADWACDIDLKGSLSKVRKNVEDWKYADTVPAFEKYVTNFWWDNYGLGVCNDKRENETKRNINKLSNLYNEYFVCEKGRWHIPGDEPLSSSSVEDASESSSSSPAGVSSSSSVQNPSGISFGTMKDSRDGQEYKTVRIGNQVWMAENLNYAAEGSRCYGDDKKNCEKYGRLYNWDIALDTTSEGCGVNFNRCTLKSDFYPRQGVCPDGWHLPDLGEWDDLIEYTDDDVDGETFGFSLQSYYWDDDWEKQYGTDKFGFNAKPAGMFDGEKYVGLDSAAIFWTSSKIVDVIMNGAITTLNYVMLEKKSSGITRSRGGDVEWGLSVRCVKGTGTKRTNSEESSSSVASSSSVYNPFVYVDPADSIRNLPSGFEFLSAYKKLGYMNFENGKQEVWFLNSKYSTSSFVRDTMAENLVNTLGTLGYAFDGAVFNDSVSPIYEDTSYIYSLHEGNDVYKVALTLVNEGGVTVGNYSIDVKVVILKDGFEELPTADKTSLRFESDIPEELSFVQSYVSSKDLVSWDDDSLTTFWYARHGTTFVTTQMTQEYVWDAVKEEAAKDSLEIMRKVLVENGFNFVKSDSIAQSEFISKSAYKRYAYTNDGLIRRHFYEKETSVAKYEIVVYVGSSCSILGASYRYEYGYSIEIHTQYKNKPE